MWGTETSTEASKEESNGAKNEPRRTGKLILILAYQRFLDVEVVLDFRILERSQGYTTEMKRSTRSLSLK